MDNKHLFSVFIFSFGVSDTLCQKVTVCQKLIVKCFKAILCHNCDVFKLYVMNPGLGLFKDYRILYLCVCKVYTVENKRHSYDQ